VSLARPKRVPRRTILHVALVLAALLLPCAPAESLDPTSADSLRDVLRMLEDPAARTGAERTGKQTPPLDPRLKGALADSPELNQELYELAAQIFSEITEATGGDESKMDEMVARGKSDPAAFAASLSPATRARLRALAEKIEAQKK
jgi:hypothetical protein